MSQNSGSSDRAPPERPEFEYETETGTQKLARKSKDNPMMAIGLSTCALVVAYGIYKYRHRGKLSTSNYLMQLRVTAQGAVIGCITLGVIKALYDRFTKKDSSDSS